jgi:hypothetical protein
MTGYLASPSDWEPPSRSEYVARWRGAASTPAPCARSGREAAARHQPAIAVQVAQGGSPCARRRKPCLSRAFFEVSDGLEPATAWTTSRASRPALRRSMPLGKRDSCGPRPALPSRRSRSIRPDSSRIRPQLAKLGPTAPRIAAMNQLTSAAVARPPVMKTWREAHAPFPSAYLGYDLARARCDSPRSPP